MKIFRRIVYPVLFVTISLVLAFFNPMLLLIFYAGAYVLVTLSRQLNYYKIVMLMKRYARNVSKLRFEIRAKLHLGFKEYSATLDDQSQSRLKNTGYV